MYMHDAPVDFREVWGYIGSEEYLMRHILLYPNKECNSRYAPGRVILSRYIASIAFFAVMERVHSWGSLLHTCLDSACMHGTLRKSE